MHVDPGCLALTPFTPHYPLPVHVNPSIHTPNNFPIVSSKTRHSCPFLGQLRPESLSEVLLPLCGITDGRTDTVVSDSVRLAPHAYATHCWCLHNCYVQLQCARCEAVLGSRGHHTALQTAKIEFIQRTCVVCSLRTSASASTTSQHCEYSASVLRVLSVSTVSTQSVALLLRLPLFRAAHGQQGSDGLKIDPPAAAAVPCRAQGTLQEPEMHTQG